MTKNELVDFIAGVAEISKTAANKAVDALVDAVTNALRKEDKVAIPDLGTFCVSKRAERAGRNPRTGEPITIAAAKVAKFKPASKLKEEINK